MDDYTRNDQMPELPEWLKQYDISVGPYDQPLPEPQPQPRDTDEDSHRPSMNDEEL